MPVTIEARRLSGVDLGKTVGGEDRISNDSFTGVLSAVDHMDGEYVMLQIERFARVYLHPTDNITITGRKS